jgi:hypothetical protein
MLFRAGNRRSSQFVPKRFRPAGHEFFGQVFKRHHPLKINRHLLKQRFVLSRNRLVKVFHGAGGSDGGLTG